MISKLKVNNRRSKFPVLGRLKMSIKPSELDTGECLKIKAVIGENILDLLHVNLIIESFDDQFQCFKI